jgi:hypothetical protein
MRSGSGVPRSGQGEQAQGAWDRKRTSGAGTGRAWVWGPTMRAATSSCAPLVPSQLGVGQPGSGFLEASEAASQGLPKGLTGARLSRGPALESVV